MKRENIKVGVRVRNTDSGCYSYNQVGTIMDNDPPLLWIKFDNDEYNNTLVSSSQIGTDADTLCTACLYSELEVIE